MISLIVGLGNPSEKYIGTRHNIGFEVVERIAAESGIRFESVSPEFDLAAVDFGGRKIILAKPMTYMNRSGLAVVALLQRYLLTPAGVLIVVDDIHLQLGKTRVRDSGSAGGHNGLVSIESELGVRSYVRLRVGVGPLPENNDLVKFVLGRFKKHEQKTVDAAIEKAADVVKIALSHGVSQAMSKHN